MPQSRMRTLGIFQRVAVDHDGLSNKITCQRPARQNGENQCNRGSMPCNDLVAIANLAGRISASSRVASVPAGSLDAQDNELRAPQPAALETVPEQDRDVIGFSDGRHALLTKAAQVSF